MKSSTSNAILALLATAGTSLAAPIEASTRILDRLDSTPSITNFKGEAANVNTNHAGQVGALSHDCTTCNQEAKHPDPAPVNVSANNLGHAKVGDDKTIDTTRYSSPKLGDAAKEAKPVINDATPVTGGVQPVTNDSALVTHDVQQLPGEVKAVTTEFQPVTDDLAESPWRAQTSGKTGRVDANHDSFGTHIIQTPGKDTTLAEAQIGDGKPKDKTDAKVQLPSDMGSMASQGQNGKDPVFEQKNGEIGPSDQNENMASQLLTKPGQGGKGDVVEMEPVMEAGYGNHQAAQASHAPSPSATPSKVAQSATHPHPSPSTVPHPSGAARPSANPHASGAPRPLSSACPSTPARPSASSQRKEIARPSSEPKYSAAAQPSTAAQSSNPHPSESAHSSQALQPSHSASSSSTPQVSSTPQTGSQADEQDQTDDDGQYSGVIDVSRLGHGRRPSPSESTSSSVPTASTTGNRPGSGPNRMSSTSGQGHDVTVATSTRNIRSRSSQARVAFSQRPKRVEPCDGQYSHGPGDVVDMCMNMDLLAYAPSGTWVCPEEMQHDIHIAYSTDSRDTINTKLGEDVAKYVRLCVDAGVL